MPSSISSATTILRKRQHCLCSTTTIRSLELYSNRYIIIDGINFDGKFRYGIGFSFSNDKSHHIRFQNFEIKNYSEQGALGRCDQCEFINLKVHDIAFKDGRSICQINNLPARTPGKCHGLYLEGKGSLIDGGEYWHNEGFGLHMRMHPVNWVVRNVRAHHNVLGDGMVFTDSPNLVYNNLIYDNGRNGIGSIGTLKIYNNTIYNDGISTCGSDIRNNIVVGGNIEHFWLSRNSRGNGSKLTLSSC